MGGLLMVTQILIQSIWTGQGRSGHPNRDGTDETRVGEDVEHVNQQDHLPLVGGLQK
jgi:hypothetical protein